MGLKQPLSNSSTGIWLKNKQIILRLETYIAHKKSFEQPTKLKVCLNNSLVLLTDVNN